MTVDLQFVGIPEAIRDFEKLAQELQKSVQKSALVSASRPLKTALKASYPKLAKTIGHRSLRQSERANVTAFDLFGGEIGENAIVVGPNKATVHQGYLRKKGKTVKNFYPVIGYWLEFGTEPHTIKGKLSKIPGRRNRLYYRGRYHGTEVMHPGIRPKKWMSRAFSSSVGAVEREFYRGLQKHIEKAMT